MNKLQLELTTKGKKISMNLNTENEATIELAVLQSFAFMGVEDPFAAVKPANDIEGKLESLEFEEEVDELKDAEEVEAKGIAMEILDNATPELKSRPRTLPLTNGSDSEDVVAYRTPDDDNEVHVPSLYTGTKEFNGITKYQTRYYCPSCGNKGKRFLALDEHVAYCHECNKGIKKESVGENGKLEQDSFGNFFIAKHGIL